MTKIKHNHLTLEERCQIFILLKSGESRRKIAKLLEKSHTTIVREIQRNGDILGRYHAQQAHTKAVKRKVSACSKPKKQQTSII